MQLLNGSPATAWFIQPNYDLIRLMAEAIIEGPQPRSIQVRKIQSHQKFDPSWGLDDKIDFFGNAAADLAAGQATQVDAPWVRSCRIQALAKIARYRAFFLQVYEAVGEMQEVTIPRQREV